MCNFQNFSEQNVSNWLLGNSDVKCTRWGHSPYEMGAYASPYEMCGVPGLLPGVDHWTSLSIWAVSPELVAGQFGRVDHGDRVALRE